MFTIILIMLSGMAAGYLFRHHRCVFLPVVITTLIWSAKFLQKNKLSLIGGSSVCDSLFFFCCL